MIFRRILLAFLTGFSVTVVTISPAFSAPDSTPILTLESGRHVAQIRRMAVDRPERYAVTASDDKTLRVWDIRDKGKLLRTIRPPIGKGNEGKLYAVAISPDGEVIAAGGWTGYEWQRENDIYLFKRSNGHLIRRIRGLPNVINHLAFSHDGRKLAVALWGGNGIRVFDPAAGRELASDTEYTGDSYSVDFNQQGSLISTSYDGFIRLYNPSFRLLKRYRTQGGSRPFTARFSSGGRKIVVGFEDSSKLEVLAAHDLSPLPSPDTSGISIGSLSRVAWSNNGRWIYTGGTYDNGRGNPIIMLPQAGGQRRVLKASDNSLAAIRPLRDGGLLYASADPAIGRLNAAGQAIWRRTSGKLDFTRYLMRRNFKVSADGSRIWFHYQHEREPSGQMLAGNIGWDLNTQTLFKSASPDMQAPRMKANGLQIRNWEDKINPTFNGRKLSLEQNEMSRSLAIAPGNRGFALGADWYLRYFAANGSQKWKVSVSLAWAVNVSRNGGWVVAALGDGTIRWYEANTGKERLAFYLHPDQKRWIAWTPQGFYSASSEQAERLMGYHLNHGADKAAQFVRVDQLKKVYARKDLVARALDSDYSQRAQLAINKAGDVRRLLRADRLPPKLQLVGGKKVHHVRQRHFRLPVKLLNQGGGASRIEYRLNGELLPLSKVRSGGLAGFSPNGEVTVSPVFTLSNGEHQLQITAFGGDGKVPSEPVNVTVKMNDPAQSNKPVLHVLSVGVSNYRRTNLNLPYAAPDAEAIYKMLKGSEKKGLHKSVNAKLLINEQATAANIRKEIASMARQVKESDVFVLYMSGHGKSVDAEYHFLPHELQFNNLAELRQRTVSGSKLAQWLKPIKAQKRLMLLDTCNSGPAAIKLATVLQNDPNSYIRNALDDEVAIGKLMESAGLSVIAASTQQQYALEGIVDQKLKKGHGLFTYTVLEALRGSADTDRNQFVSVGELDAYIKRRVPALSRQKWQYEQSPMSVTSGDFLLVRQ